MNHLRAATLDVFPLKADTDTAARFAADVAVEIVGIAAFAELRPAWTDLLARADSPNLFMDPALLKAAAETFPEVERHVVLAWKPMQGERQLIGVWAFALGHPTHSVLPVRVLNAPPAPYGYLAAPVIDRSCLEQALNAMLDRLAATPGLPKIIALEAMAMDTPTMQALTRVLARRDAPLCIFDQAQRPKLASGLDGKSYLEQTLSSGSRKKLRQHRRRLAEKGALTSVAISEPAAVRRALEEFFAVEASGWKGRSGTALLCNEKDVAFMRAAVGALADLGRACIHALYLDGRPVSMQLVARCGRTAFTWKTAYDEAFHDFSPGMLLLEDYTAAFLADPDIAFVDSCAHDAGSFMASAWAERQAIADVWIDVRRGGSPSFRLLCDVQKLYRAAGGAAKRVYRSIKRRTVARERH